MFWFTSDTHFGHANIIRYCNRPFDSVEHMDRVLIENWNRVVGSGDTVYHLGDFTLGNATRAREYLGQLNGEIRMLRNPWHHDRGWLWDLRNDNSDPQTATGYYTIPEEPIVVLEPKETKYPKHIVLCHYPLAAWDRKHYGAWHLHGHSHGKHCDPLAIDVGVDACNYTPVSLAQIAGWYAGWYGWITGEDDDAEYLRSMGILLGPRLSVGGWDDCYVPLDAFEQLEANWGRVLYSLTRTEDLWKLPHERETVNREGPCST